MKSSTCLLNSLPCTGRQLYNNTLSILQSIGFQDVPLHSVLWYMFYEVELEWDLLFSIVDDNLRIDQYFFDSVPKTFLPFKQRLLWPQPYILVEQFDKNDINVFNFNDNDKESNKKDCRGKIFKITRYQPPGYYNDFRQLTFDVNLKKNKKIRITLNQREKEQGIRYDENYSPWQLIHDDVITYFDDDNGDNKNNNNNLNRGLNNLDILSLNSNCQPILSESKSIALYINDKGRVETILWRCC